MLVPRLILKKTECILLGSLKENFHNTYNIRVNTTCFKCLGIYLGHDKDECYKRNWENTMKDMEKLFESWKKRKLTIFGKCEIINTLAISKLIYIASILHLPPPNFIKDVNKLIYSFLWNSRDRIKRNTIIGPIKDGAVTYMTEISLIVTLNNQFNSTIKDGGIGLVD